MATSKRIRITLAADLLAKIDGVDRSRSRFISEAVRHELSQRRRDELLRSLAVPLPETKALQEAALGDWLADVAEAPS